MSDEPVKPKPSGVWKKGESGNKNGRPRLDMVDDLDSLKKMDGMLKKATPEAIRILIKLMREATTPEHQHKFATAVIDKMVVVSKEKDRKEDREQGVKTPAEDDKPKKPVTRVSFDLRAVGEDRE